MKRALVCGAGGFIGSHLVTRLKREGYWIRGVDLKYPEFDGTLADDFRIGDLRDPTICRRATDQRFDEVYQLAADTGGVGYTSCSENDARELHNSALVSLNVLGACYRQGINLIFYASSASIYPEYKQLDPEDGDLDEESACPAQPDGEQGWESAERARLPRVPAQLRPGGAHRPPPQRLRSGGSLGRRQGDRGGGAVPQGRRGA